MPLFDSDNLGLLNTEGIVRLQQLHLLLSIAETGNMRASAEALHVTQPALTKALKQLEEELGTTLAVRGPKGMRLSPAGELFAARAAGALRELERARAEVAAFSGNAHSQVSVGLSPAAAMLIAPQALSRFTSRWPEVQVRVIDALYPRSLAQIRAGELDLTIGPLPLDLASSDTVVRPLFDYDHIIAARRDHPLASKRRLADLSDAFWVRIGPAGGPGDPSKTQFEVLGLKNPKVQMQCESFSTLLSLMPKIDMLGIMPLGFFERFGAREGLVRLPIGDPLPRITICAAWRADAPLTPSAQHMLESFTAEGARYSSSLPP